MAAPAEHYATAELYLDQAAKATDPLHAQRLTARAGVYATLATVLTEPLELAEDTPDPELEAIAGDTAYVADLIDALEALAAWSAGVSSVPGDEAMSHAEAEGYVLGYDAARAHVSKLVAGVLGA